MKFQALIQAARKKLPLIALGVVGFVVMAGGVYWGLSSLDNNTPRQTETTSEQQAANENPQEADGGTALQGGSIDLIGSVVSTRNLSGLLVQINQIDVCAAPEATLFVALTNEDGEVFTDVRASDFTVKVDGEAQENFEFTQVAEEDLPLHTVLALDSSGSMQGTPINQLKSAAKSYVDRSDKNDKAAVIKFDSVIDTLQGMTANKTKIKSAINRLSAQGDTALYDAMSTAAEATPDCGRKAVLLMTDGKDTSSKNFNLKQATSKANHINTPVFVIGLKSEDFQPRVLQRMAKDTGAQYFETPNPNKLGEIYRTIDQQLAGQYVFKFKLDIPETGQEHRVEISAGVPGGKTTSSRSFVY